MVAVTRGLNQYATYWPPGSPDGEGGMEGVNPVVIRCRWQDVAVLFRNAQGEQLTSSSVVYVDRAVEVGGLLAEGDLSEDFASDGWLDPDTLYGAARPVRGINRSPSVDATRVLHKAFL